MSHLPDSPIQAFLTNKLVVVGFGVGVVVGVPTPSCTQVALFLG
jgi:hypothetical protein